MSDKSINTLVSIVYPDQNRAAEVFATLERLQTEQVIDIEDIVYVTKDQKGKVKLHQSTNLTGSGAAVGSLWGLMIGLLFFAPLAGAAIGAGAGALSGKATDYGIDDNFMKNLGNKMKPNSSAIFVSIRSVVVDKVVPQISKFGGDLMKTSLSKDGEKKLQEALDRGSAKTDWDQVVSA